jgi:hypothetical protein
MNSGGFEMILILLATLIGVVLIYMKTSRIEERLKQLEQRSEGKERTPRDNAVQA